MRKKLQIRRESEDVLNILRWRQCAVASKLPCRGGGDGLLRDGPVVESSTYAIKISDLGEKNEDDHF